MEIWDAKIELLKNYSEIEIEKYTKSKIMFKKKISQISKKILLGYL